MRLDIVEALKRSWQLQLQLAVGSWAEITLCCICIVHRANVLCCVVLCCLLAIGFGYSGANAVKPTAVWWLKAGI